MVMLTLESLSFQYKDHAVLKDISFSIEPQSVTCLIGPNGSGKTTLLDCIMGIHPDYTGRIFLNGEDVALMKNNIRMRTMGYVPQGKNHTFPFTVKDMVVMGRAPYLSTFQHPGEEDEALAMQSLKALGMESYADRIFTKLSGGEQQLVILARALTQDPELLIFDEPMVSLDYFNELQFLEILVKLVKEYHKTIIMATHSPNHAFYFSEHNIPSRVLMLKNGEVIGFGTPQEVLTEAHLKTVYKIEASVVSYDEGNRFIIPKRIKGE
jgi:iron complex transport system ATP-binding protein